MSFPDNLDMDRVLAEALAGIQIAVDGWLSGQPISEEPLMSRLTEQFTRRRRRCDVGVREPVTMNSKVAFLHRRGVQLTDAYGSDLAITIEIPDLKYRKTCLFQMKVSTDFSTRLERAQLNQAIVDTRTKERSFVLVADRARQRMRVKSVDDAIKLFKADSDTVGVDCADWMTISEWLTKWISCDVGLSSQLDDPNSVEKLLQEFVVEPPEGWECPWGQGNAEDYSIEQLPARAWLEMVFQRMANGEEGAKR